jgi:hypothetical protein
MSVAAAMSMAMAVEVMRSGAEAAIDGAAIRPAVEAGHRREPGAAVTPPHETHRHGADGRGAHQRQDHPARSFHGITCASQKLDMIFARKLRRNCETTVG